MIVQTQFSEELLFPMTDPAQSAPIGIVPPSTPPSVGIGNADGLPVTPPAETISIDGPVTPTSAAGSAGNSTILQPTLSAPSLEESPLSPALEEVKLPETPSDVIVSIPAPGEGIATADSTTSGSVDLEALVNQTAAALGMDETGGDDKKDDLGASSGSPTLGPIVTQTPIAPPAPGSLPPVPGSLPQSSPTVASTPFDITSPSTITALLASQGAITKEQADQVELESIQTGVAPDLIVEEKKLVSDEVLTRARATLNNIPFIKLEETGVSPEALAVLPEGVARRYNMLPFNLNKQDKTLSVAMVNPQDLLAIDFAEQKTDYRLIPHYAAKSEVERLIAERYAQSLSTEVTQALKESGQVAQETKRLEDLSSLSGEVVKQAPITKIVETVLAFAMKARASDIHIEPQETRTRVRYRIDGLLTEKLILPKNVHDGVVSRIKILSDLKIDEKRIPQDGRFTFMSSGEEVDLRVSTLPTIHGEKIVMRLLKKDTTVPSLGDLGLNGVALRQLEDASKVPHGIVLVTGPTGSGKTTTLYSVLHMINTPKVNIVTLEDPVEYQMPGVNQVQINPQAGLTFASGLRAFLRQDPNIIMVGEIRDSETVELAIQASLTGHLVFSTLHTSSAAGALPRLMDMGAEPFLLASSMTLTMAQRIVRKVNDEYKEYYKPEAAVVEDIKRVLGDRFDQWCKQKGCTPNDIELVRAKEDRPQTEPEYHGRIGIYEVMRITEEIGRMILERKSGADIEKVAITKDNMLLMKQDGYLKALDGLTTIEEVLRVAEV